MEEIGAGADIQHVISFDKPAHASISWLGDLRSQGYYEIPPPPLTPHRSVLLCLPFFSSVSHCLPLTSPALSPELRQVLVVSHPIVFHWHWDGPEPAWSKEAQGMLVFHSCPHTHTHKHTHTHIRHLQKQSRLTFAGLWILNSHDYNNASSRWGRGLTISGSAPPVDRWHVLVLVVLVTVKYSILLHHGKSAPTLLIQVGVWWLRSFCGVDIRLKILIRQISLVLSLATESKMPVKRKDEAVPLTWRPACKQTKMVLFSWKEKANYNLDIAYCHLNQKLLFMFGVNKEHEYLWKLFSQHQHKVIIRFWLLLARFNSLSCW